MRLRLLLPRSRFAIPRDGRSGGSCDGVVPGVAVELAEADGNDCCCCCCCRRSVAAAARPPVGIVRFRGGSACVATCPIEALALRGDGCGCTGEPRFEPSLVVAIGRCADAGSPSPLACASPPRAAADPATAAEEAEGAAAEAEEAAEAEVVVAEVQPLAAGEVSAGGSKLAAGRSLPCPPPTCPPPTCPPLRSSPPLCCSIALS